MPHRRFLVPVASLVMLGLATPATALFHENVIDEMVTSYGGDANVQFIEMRMLFALQIFVTNSVFAAFDDQGNYIKDILVVPSNLANSAAGTRWLIGTAAFQTQSGLKPDFVMPAGILPTGGGMVCFGGGGGISPASPSSWSRTDFASYVDCLAYGTYHGSSNVKTGAPTMLNADGHALERMSTTMNNSADFVCADPATPQNNAGMMVSLPATDPCEGAAATPTATAVPSTPTPAPPTATPGPSGTVPPSHPCVGDCNGDGVVTVNEIIVAVNIALGGAEIGSCPAFGGATSVTISDLVAAVNSALNGCPMTAAPS